MSNSVIAWNTEAEERKITANNKVNCTLIKMGCPPPSLLAHCLSFPVLEWYGGEFNGCTCFSCGFRKRYGGVFSSFWLRGWETDRAGWISYPHPFALFQRIVCTQWTGAKFKRTVPDSSSQQSHYPWCAQAPGEEPTKWYTFTFPRLLTLRRHHACIRMRHLVLLFTLTHSPTSAPKIEN